MPHPFLCFYFIPTPTPPDLASWFSLAGHLALLTVRLSPVFSATVFSAVCQYPFVPLSLPLSLSHPSVTVDWAWSADTHQVLSAANLLQAKLSASWLCRVLKKKICTLVQSVTDVLAWEEISAVRTDSCLLNILNLQGKDGDSSSCNLCLLPWKEESYDTLTFWRRDFFQSKHSRCY